MSDSAATDKSSAPATVGGRRHKGGVSVKTLKKVLKKAGLKVSGKKATLTRRAKKARLMGGAEKEEEMKEEMKVEMPMETGMEGARRRRSRSRGFRLY
jgi:hypothetical protein